MKKWENRDHSNHWTDKDVEAHWNGVAHIYIKENIKVKKAHDQRFTETIKHLQVPDPANILNISSRDCEANDYVLEANPGARVINAEISQGLMDAAQQVRPYVKQVKIENYSTLPFEDRTFNRIICLETLEHVADPVAFLKELHRISIINTRMVLSCPPQTSEIPYRVFTFLFGGHGEGPHRFLRSKEVKVMFEKTGWKLLLHKGTVLFPVGPSRFQDLGERIISKLQKTFVSELGIRQFYVCEKYK